MHALDEYTKALLPFHATLNLEQMPSPLPADEMQRALDRMERAALRSPSGGVVLLGLGSGVLARELSRRLPAAVSLKVAELQPELINTISQFEPELLDWWRPQQRGRLLADTSPWSMLLLLHYCTGLQGLVPLRNPELREGSAATRYGLLQKTLVMARARELDARQRQDPTPSLSAAAIVHPGEPHLQEFLEQFPSWLHELVIVWDAPEPPAHGLVVAPPLRELARPLADDFAQQRNVMLDACRGDWVLFLDCDERLSSEAWNLVPMLLRQTDFGGYWLPRRTFFPDREHAMAGMGLWPDLQLRLVRNMPGLRFTRPVHERLTGLKGAVAITPGLAIEHDNQLSKSPEEIQKKYNTFNRAGNLRHIRSQDYPHMPLAFFQNLEKKCGLRSLLALRYNPSL